MTYTSITLSDPVTGLSSVLLPRAGVKAAVLDVQPAVRAVSNPVVGGDGARDTTQRADAAAVTLTLQLISGCGGAGYTSTYGSTYPDAGIEPEALLDEIGPLLAPFARPDLIVGNDQWASPRLLPVRFDSKTAPVDNPVSTMVAISWKVPGGVWTGTVPVEYDLAASAPSATGAGFTAAGLPFTTTGVAFPAATMTSDSLVTVPGTMRPPWKARLYGPCTAPALANDTTGDDIVFTSGLALNPGEYVELDSAARTANFLSDPGQPRLDLLDFAATGWWDLQPGIANLVRYHPLSGAASGAVLTFTPCWGC